MARAFHAVWLSCAGCALLGSGTWLKAWRAVPVRTDPGYVRDMRQTLAASDQRRGVGAAHFSHARVLVSNRHVFSICSPKKRRRRAG